MPETPPPQIITISVQELENHIRNELFGLQWRFAHGGDLPVSLINEVAQNILRMALKEPVCLTKKT